MKVIETWCAIVIDAALYLGICSQSEHWNQAAARRIPRFSPSSAAGLHIRCP